ncbi:hypothetical protein DFH09DRAFT_1103649 [Mycena vulgaris]|nr:hypothetical protein DFH09DRAFT_1103649 [Mycena vulgaris]
MFSLLPLVVVSYFLLSCRAGQTSPSSWRAPLSYLSVRRPNVTMSPVDRMSIAGAAIEKAISMLGADAQFDGQSLGYAGQLYSQMAEFDIATNQTKYANTLKQYFLQAPHKQTNFSDVFTRMALGGWAGDRPVPILTRIPVRKSCAVLLVRVFDASWRSAAPAASGAKHSI